MTATSPHAVEHDTSAVSPVEQHLDETAARVADIIDEALEEKGEGALFDGRAFTRDDIPVTDGNLVDLIKFAFGGALELDATDDFALELYHAMKLGSGVSLRIDVQVVGKGTSWREKEVKVDGEVVETEEVSTQTVKLKVVGVNFLRA